MLSEKNTLNKNERLKSRKLIESLFTDGAVMSHFPFRLIYKTIHQESTQYYSKIAISVTKRNFKKAVDRNHIKRKIRESYRKNKSILNKTLQLTNQNAYFIVIYVSKNDLSYQEIEKEMIVLLNKFAKRIQTVDNKELKT